MIATNTVRESAAIELSDVLDRIATLEADLAQTAEVLAVVHHADVKNSVRSAALEAALRPFARQSCSNWSHTADQCDGSTIPREHWCYHCVARAALAHPVGTQS